MEDVKCSVCGAMYSQVERDKDYPKIPSSMAYCGYCIEKDEQFALCQSCHAYFEKNQGVEVEERLICHECKEANTIACSVCGQIVTKNRRNRVLSNLCEDCESKQLYRKHIDGLKLGSAVSHSVSFGSMKTMKTVHLMSRLRHSYSDIMLQTYGDKYSSFDVLLINMWQWYGRRRMLVNYGYNLVVLHGLPSQFISFTKGSCTMTEFTKSNIFIWDKVNTERSKERIELTNGEVLCLWDNPYNLRAMTVSDMDYRKEYVYGELKYEGNNYGDTSDFLIVGSIANKSKG